MDKRISVLLFFLIITCLLSSCSINEYWTEMNEVYPEQRNKVKVISHEEGGYHIEYEDVRYNVDRMQLFTVREDGNTVPENDLLVGWAGLPYGLSYLDKYYSYTADNPVFIYISRFNELYLRNDYAFETDTFILEGNENGIVFSDMLTASQNFAYEPVFTNYEGSDIVLYSQQCPRLRVLLRVFYKDGVWYAGGKSSDTLFTVSDEFLTLLTEVGIVSGE